MNNKGEGITSEVLKEIKHLWEDTPKTAKQIAEQFNVSKNSIVGYAQRNNWISYNVASFKPLINSIAKTTMAQRLDALNAAMDKVKEETETTIRNRYKQPKNTDKSKKKRFVLFPGPMG